MIKIYTNILLIIMLTGVSFGATSTNIITWRIIDWPPFYIVKGKDAGHGIYDELLAKVAKKLPEYEHRKVIMNTQRVVYELQKGSQVCHPSALEDTPALLSKTNSFLLPHRIIYNATNQTQFNQQQNISLNELLREPKITLGVANDRYSGLLNNIIKRYDDRKNLVHKNNYHSLIEMFLRQRIDAIIEYPPVVTYSKQQLNITMNNSSLAIKELADTEYLPVHFACPNTEWGKRVIEKLNKMLVEETHQKDYLNFRLKWYDGKSVEQLKQYYQRDYLLDKTN